ncbi:MAG TPA: hypothetical protein VGJ21_12265 [Terracidiphilus sp.]|jgi:hypothetical protein
MELIEVILGWIFAALGIYTDYREDLRNRNDRGLLKKPSSKYVC